MSDYKINRDAEKNVKLGMSEEIAFITACVQNNKVEKTEGLIEDLKEEQKLLYNAIKDFVPFSKNIEVYNIDANNNQDQNANI